MQDTFTVNGVTLSQPQPTYWRTKDVAKHFNVSPQAVYRWVSLGILPVHRTPGGHLRFVEAEVKAAQVKREES